MPASGVSNPAIMRSVVVLPHPDGPSIEKNSPPGIVNDTSSTAVTEPKRFVQRLHDDLARHRWHLHRSYSCVDPVQPGETERHEREDAG